VRQVEAGPDRYLQDPASGAGAEPLPAAAELDSAKAICLS
jgi:hypothetical protein